jgi:hypothetical protein
VTTRREQVREAIDRHRRRRKHGLLWRPILITKSQLDQLEQRGYLDPGRDRADECDAIEIFLADEAASQRSLSQGRPRSHRPRDTLEVFCPEVLKLEQIAE